MAEKGALAKEYIRDVLEGRILVGKWVRLAVERQARDLETGHLRGLRFDEDRGQHALDWYGFLKHSKGEWAGQPFEPLPWQAFCDWATFGWVREDGTRRFRTAYEEVGRKAGKSTRAAARGLYLFLGDGEAGAEVYAAATMRDQARIVHGESERMVGSSPELRRRVAIVKNNLSHAATHSKYVPLGADEDSMDGLNPHGVIIDELHAHKSRKVWDVLRTAMGARRQPLLYAITTAGWDRSGVCWEQHRYSQRVLDGIIEDDSWFAFIAALDTAEEGGGEGGNGAKPAGDDWTDERVWVKANPSLGLTPKMEYLRQQVREALQKPAYQNTVLRMHMNLWTQQQTRYVPMERWDVCGRYRVEPSDLEGQVCFGGLDLASSEDIAAFVLVFPPEGYEARAEDRARGEGDEAQEPAWGGLVRVLARFWIPAENVAERGNRDRANYEAWVRDGWIATTPGNVIDDEFVVGEVGALSEQVDIQDVRFDRWGSRYVASKLQDAGVEMVEFGQGYKSFSEPTKELLRLVLSGRLAHGGNPVLRWMADNLVVEFDAAKNRKPTKSKSAEKIDGMVALIMAIDGMMRSGGQAGSVYETRGVITIR